MYSLHQKSSSSKFILTCGTARYIDKTGVEKFAPIILLPLSIDYVKQELVFTLNSSINVFDHASLRDAYADPKVSSISMHANIEAKFDADQVVYNEYMKDF